MRRTTFALAGLALAAAALGAGTFHVVTGHQIAGMRLERKPSFTWNETFVNLDTLAALPLAAARARYPLYLERLDRELTAAGLERVTPANVHALFLGMTPAVAETYLGPPATHTEIGATRIESWRSLTGARGVTVTYTDGQATSIEPR